MVVTASAKDRPVCDNPANGILKGGRGQESRGTVHDSSDPQTVCAMVAKKMRAVYLAQCNVRHARAHGGDSCGREHLVGVAKAELAVSIVAPALHFSRLHDYAAFIWSRVKCLDTAGQARDLLRSGVEVCCGAGAEAKLRSASVNAKMQLHEPRARE